MQAQILALAKQLKESFPDAEAALNVLDEQVVMLMVFPFEQGGNRKQQTVNETLSAAGRSAGTVETQSLQSSALQLCSAFE
jgi:hypothetical protein